MMLYTRLGGWQGCGFLPLGMAWERRMSYASYLRIGRKGKFMDAWGLPKSPE
jgi:hypothetical protein